MDTCCDDGKWMVVAELEWKTFLQPYEPLHEYVYCAASF